MGFEFWLSVFGTGIGVVALVLYMWERFRIEPVIVRVNVRKMDEPDVYLIEADLSNEGGRKAEGCSAIIEINSNIVGQLAFVPVDSPIGRIGVDPLARKMPIKPPLTPLGCYSVSKQTTQSMTGLRPGRITFAAESAREDSRLPRTDRPSRVRHVYAHAHLAVFPRPAFRQ